MFVGRVQEKRLLEAAVKAPEPRIALIYGRRRIGKTSLIRAAVGKSPAIFIEGLENQSQQTQIASFLRQVREQTGREAGPATTWEDALLGLHRLLGKKRMVLVLDEFQWLANYRQELISALKMVWENYLSQTAGRTLILCGSIASFMTTRVLRGSAFHGRVDTVVHLQGFRLAETAALLKGRGSSEILDAQSFTGGVPKYLELLAAAPSVPLGMEREAFTAGGYFVDEYQRIFVSHFGRNAEYERLVRALAGAPYGLLRKELAALAKVEEGGMLSQRLYDLEAAGFISSHRPFDKTADSRLIRYLLSDPWMSFYYAFLRPKLKQIQQGDRTDLFAAVRQSGAFRAWMGRAFELVCIRHAGRIAELLGFAGVDYEAGPWFRAPRRQLAGVQIDLAFARADHVITLCEMKRHTAPLGKAVITEVERKAQLLQAEYPRHTIQRVLVSDGPVSREVERSGYFFRILGSPDLVEPD